jgi:uncharacterized protein YdeI (YjbR/CyaY-like superfamily)
MMPMFQGPQRGPKEHAMKVARETGGAPPADARPSHERERVRKAAERRLAPKPGPARDFSGPDEFREWLERHGGSQSELHLRCYKTHARHRGLTYRQALDEALCFGWIDAVRRSLDEDSFTQRFTPRKAESYWSAVNVRRFHELEAEGRVSAAGREAFARRSEKIKGRYSFESRPRALAPAYLKKLRANPRAWRFYESQPPWYRRTTAFWIMSAMRPETRARRLDILIASSERGKRIPSLVRAPKGKAKDRRP